MAKIVYSPSGETSSNLHHMLARANMVYQKVITQVLKMVKPQHKHKMNIPKGPSGNWLDGYQAGLKVVQNMTSP